MDVVCTYPREKGEGEERTREGKCEMVPLRQRVAVMMWTSLIKSLIFLFYFILFYFIAVWLEEASYALIELGATAVYVVASHAVLSQVCSSFYLYIYFNFCLYYLVHTTIFIIIVMLMILSISLMLLKGSRGTHHAITNLRDCIDQHHPPVRRG